MFRERQRGGIFRRPHATYRYARAIFSISNFGVCTLPVDDNRNAKLPRAAELIGIARRPWRLYRRKVFVLSHSALRSLNRELVEQSLDTKRRSGEIGRVRHGAERHEITVDVARVDLAFAESGRLAKRREEGDVGARTESQPTQSLMRLRAMTSH